MRIAWLTPFNPRSAIGQYSQAIVEHLGATEEVVVFAAEQGPDLLPQSCAAPTVRLPRDPDAALLAELGSFDLVVHNFGNHTPYHQTIYDVAVRQPGIVIMHDLVMRDFFLGYYLHHRRDFPGFGNALRYSHGDEGQALA